MGDFSPASTHHQCTRQHPRVEIDLSARLVLGTSDRAVSVRDFGGGGLFVATDDAPAPGTTIDVRFRHVSRLECSARGRVAWRTTRGFGIAFDEMTPAMTRFARTLTRMPAHLRALYLAGVADPSLHIEL